jgi:sorbitol/mannitol transport system permease protein
MTQTLSAPAGTAVPPPARPRRVRRGRGGAILGVVAWIVGIAFFFPVAWMVFTSLHSEQAAATNPPDLAAPLTTDGYREFFATNPWPYLINSATASVVSTALVVVLALFAGYALAIRPVRKWSDVLFFFLTTKMLPAVAGLLPVYLIAQHIGLLDNIWLMVILYTAMNLPIAVWMMHSFLAEVPVAILEAAALDGARLPTVMRRVILPIASPGIAATALICFIFAWNEMLFARVLTGVVAGTAPVFLTSFVTTQGLFLAKVCAAATAISIPVLVAGFAAQNKLVQGLSLGAVK